MQSEMQRLTRAEEEMMLIMWKLERALLKDITAAYPDPKPSVSTISTLLRTLERKGFVSHKAYSKTFEYYILVQKRNYVRQFFQDFLKKYFDESYEELIRFISSESGMEMRAPEKEKAQEKPEPVLEIDTSQLSLW